MRIIKLVKNFMVKYYNCKNKHAVYKYRPMIIMGFVTMVLLLNGCAPGSDAKALPQTGDIQSEPEGADYVDSKEIAGNYRDIYEQAQEAKTLSSIDTIKKIVGRLGSLGYAAVDNGNQVDMVNPEKVESFCASVEDKKEAEQTIICVLDNGGFVRYDLQTAEGEVNVTRNSLSWDGGKPQIVEKAEYFVYSWVYSGGNYLFFEEEHKPGFDGTSGHTAIRIKPLDERCRELNRQYIEPIGYGAVNMFIADWSEDDFKDLNFYDLYKNMFIMKYGQSRSAFDIKEGKSYEIAADDFEAIFMTYFRIEPQTLRHSTTYHEESGTYQYRARGVYDCGPTPDSPYSEVTGYEEKDDGTIKLTVIPVWPDRNVEKAFSHELVIRPLPDGGVQYVSNRVLPSEENMEPTWYTERLTDEEWEEYYGNTKEKKLSEAKSECESAMVSVQEIYESADKGDSFNSCITADTAAEMMKVLGQTQLPVSAAGFQLDMCNYEKMEDFLTKALEKESTSVTTYEIHSDGGLGRREYIFNGSEMYELYTTASWNENRPFIVSNTYEKIERWDYTDKGWLVLKYQVPVYPEVTEVVNENFMLRVKPPDKNFRKAEKAFLMTIGYQGNNLFCLDWNSEHMSELDYNGLYEYFYTQKYNQKFESQKYAEGIPEDEFEELMMEYLPVSADQLRQYAKYDEISRTYDWTILGCGNYSPNAFGASSPEITDITENKDGTHTLTVDAVCEPAGSDSVMSHQLTVQFTQDGKIKYLKNEVLDDGLLNIPRYQYRFDPYESQRPN